VLRALAVICYALASFLAGWLLAFTAWVTTDLDSALGTVLGIGELDCRREGENCGSWSERIANHWWLIVLAFTAAFGLAMLPWFRARLSRWLSRWDRPISD
jgi:hypothetical protein